MIEKGISEALYCYHPFGYSDPRPYQTFELDQSDVKVLLNGGTSKEFLLMDPPGLHRNGDGVIFMDLTIGFIISNNQSNYRRLYDLHQSGKRDYLHNRPVTIKLLRNNIP